MGGEYINVQICKCANVQISCAEWWRSLRGRTMGAKSPDFALYTVSRAHARVHRSLCKLLSPFTGALRLRMSERGAPSMEATFETSRSTRFLCECLGRTMGARSPDLASLRKGRFRVECDVSNVASIERASCAKVCVKVRFHKPW